VPHLLCRDFLHHLGSDRVWQAGRHRVDAARAAGLVFERLAPALKGVHAAGLVLPPYLDRAKVGLLLQQAEKLRSPIAISVIAPLALAWAAYGERAWEQVALVVDADDQALSWTLVEARADQLHVLGEQILPRLGVRAWKERVLDAVAERCVHHSRRDPRESGPAEQMLYDQLDDALEAARRGYLVELEVQTRQWYQNLHLRPEEIDVYAAPLVRQALEGMWAALVAASCVGRPSAVLASAAADRLPGLLAAFPEHLGERVPVRALPAEAAARAAHELAARCVRNLLPRGTYESSLPLPPAALTPSEGPPRPVFPIREPGHGPVR
jgi:hypothetical protein